MLYRYTTVLPGIDTLFAGLWPGRTALQQHLCNNSNGVVAIVQRGKEFLIRGKIPPVVPLQWHANKYKGSRCPTLSDIMGGYTSWSGADSGVVRLPSGRILVCLSSRFVSLIAMVR